MSYFNDNDFDVDELVKRIDEMILMYLKVVIY